MSKFDDKRNDMQVAKVDEDQRLVFGFAQICKIDGEEYYDSDNEHFPEAATVKAWADFMDDVRTHKAMHSGGAVGQVTFAFPLVTDIAKAMGITCAKSGVIVGVRVHDDDVLAKFKSGEYTGFSIGGNADFKDID